MTQGDSDVLLTMSDVRAWKAERESLIGEIAALQAKADELDRRLEVVSSFLSPKAKAAIFGEPTGEAGVSAWVRETLRAADGPMTFKQMMEASVGTDIEDRLRRHTNALYNAVSRLHDRGEVMRVGKTTIFAKEVYYRLVSQGRNPELEFKETELNGPAAARAILARHPPGMPTSDLLAEMREDPVIGPKIARNSSYGYTLLGRMVRRGQVVRAGGLYLLSSEAGEGGDEDQDQDDA